MLESTLNMHIKAIEKDIKVELVCLHASIDLPAEIYDEIRAY